MKLVVTGSNGLIGSEVVRHFDQSGWEIHGADNNMRAQFFGPQGDTRWQQQQLVSGCRKFTHHELDIRDRTAVTRFIETVRPDAIVHTAAQPSHDRAAQIPYDDFDVNAVGTLNLLEAVAANRTRGAFRHMSTNKVYGDAPNELPLVELDTRWEFANQEDYNGIDESMRIDRSKHSLFGAVQGGGGYHGPGIRPLFPNEDLLPAGRLPYGSQPFRRGTSRLSELPGEGEYDRGHLHGVWVQGKTGTGQYSLLRRGPFYRGLHQPARRGQGLQPGRRQGQTPVPFWRLLKKSALSSGKPMNYQYR